MNVDSLLAISPVIPVVTIRDVRHAVPLAQALLDGGVAIIEVTLRTPVALPAIAQIASSVAGMTVLAGTVCTTTQVKDSVEAGAAALVSPGLTDRLAASVEAHRVPWLPGIATASEILRGLELGFERFKLFPASIAGGVEAVQAFAGPFPAVRFCPTGGIDRAAGDRYLKLGNVACVGGSWVAPESSISAEDWEGITANARFASSLRRGR
jgi:2-dehydro-3-deoxyphosphogluconate aldolase/(4S)-4-hydroxy-2-oxoglutarate aldolase